MDVNHMSTDNAIQDAPRFVRRRQAGEYLTAKYGFGAAATLAKLACLSSDGPPMRKVGSRVVLYDLADLDRWALARIGGPLASTSEVAATKRQPTCNNVEAV